MKRKDVGIRRVYDARALRVIVGDKNGTLHGQAVQCCYNLLNIIHKYISSFLPNHSSHCNYLVKIDTNWLLSFLYPPDFGPQLTGNLTITLSTQNQVVTRYNFYNKVFLFW